MTRNHTLTDREFHKAVEEALDRDICIVSSVRADGFYKKISYNPAKHKSWVVEVKKGKDAEVERTAYLDPLDALELYNRTTPYSS